MNNVAEMTLDEIKARIDRLEHRIFIEEMAENYNGFYIKTLNDELRGLKALYEEKGGRWSD